MIGIQVSVRYIDPDKLCSSCSLPCPVNYNPADHYVQVLAVVPGEEEESRARISAICKQFYSSQQGLELEKLSFIVPDKGERGATRASPYKVIGGTLS